VGAYKIEARQEDGRTLRIIIHGALMNEYIEVKGVLNYTISVPDSIDTITIGNKKTIIWNKGDGHQGLRTWRFGREVRERDENEHNHSDMETK
jgi:hypothetical protein